MTDNFITLNESDVLRLGIKTSDGKDTGEYLEFDLEDITLPLRYQDLVDSKRRNLLNLKNQYTIIEKRQDVRSKKKLLSKNEEDKIRALNFFFKKEVEIYNMFLGENGVQKLLNGRNIGWTTLREIDEIIDKYIVPKLDLKMDKITEKVRQKYAVPFDTKKEEIEVLE